MSSVSLAEALSPAEGTEAASEPESQPAEEAATEPQESAESTGEGEVAEASTEEQAPGEADAEESKQEKKSHRVPLGELIEERKKRQELERRVAELSGQNQVYEKIGREKKEEAEESPEDQFYKSPVEYLDKKGREILQQQYVQRANMSEFYARKNHQDYDQAFEGFQEYSKSNPAVLQQLWTHPAPAEYAYEEGKRFLEAKEYGGSVSGLKDKLRKEIREEVLRELKQNGTQAAASQVTKSNADARAASGKGASKWDGPPSLQEIFKR